jgi:hypothetical protein
LCTNTVDLGVAALAAPGNLQTNAIVQDTGHKHHDDATKDITDAATSVPS